MFDVLCAVVVFFLALYGYRFCKYLGRICELRVRYYTFQNDLLEHRIKVNSYWDEHNGLMIVREGEADEEEIVPEEERV